MLIAGKISTYLFALSLTLLEQPLNVDMTELECMVEVIHFEAQGESRSGKKGVANVVLNRMESKRFPDTICEVVHQPMQFSYRNKTKYPPVRLKNRTDVKSFMGTLDIAIKAVQNNLNDNTYGADHYFAHSKVNPKWYNSDNVTIVIGNHTFIKL